MVKQNLKVKDMVKLTLGFDNILKLIFPKGKLTKCIATTLFLNESNLMLLSIFVLVLCTHGILIYIYFFYFY